MARLSRIVIPSAPHHVNQRGNRRLSVFFSDDDRQEYVSLVASSARASGTRCLAWCLMDNHVHLILIPADEDGLRATLGEAHRRYTRMINFREGWRGHLFQGRFASYPMDDAHLMAAVRYVENNPVAAGLVKQAEDWKWSSAKSHVQGRRTRIDQLTDMEVLKGAGKSWRAMLRQGLEAGNVDAGGEVIAEMIDARLRTGRPLAGWMGQAAGGSYGDPHETGQARSKTGKKQRWKTLSMLSPEFHAYSSCSTIGLTVCDNAALRWDRKIHSRSKR